MLFRPNDGCSCQPNNFVWYYWFYCWKLFDVSGFRLRSQALYSATERRFRTGWKFLRRIERIETKFVEFISTLFWNEKVSNQKIISKEITNYWLNIDFFYFIISLRMAIRFSNLSKPFVFSYMIYAVICICTLFLQLHDVMSFIFFEKIFFQTFKEVELISMQRGWIEIIGRIELELNHFFFLNLFAIYGFM